MGNYHTELNQGNIQRINEHFIACTNKINGHTNTIKQLQDSILRLDIIIQQQEQQIAELRDELRRGPPPKHEN